MSRISLSDKSLSIDSNRGVVPENSWDCIQLTHFDRLDTVTKIDDSSTYEIQSLANRGNEGHSLVLCFSLKIYWVG